LVEDLSKVERLQSDATLGMVMGSQGLCYSIHSCFFYSFMFLFFFQLGDHKVAEDYFAKAWDLLGCKTERKKQKKTNTNTNKNKIKTKHKIKYNQTEQTLTCFFVFFLASESHTTLMDSEKLLSQMYGGYCASIGEKNK